MLLSDYRRKSGLAQSGRSVQKYVVEGLAALFCGFDIYRYLLLDLVLTDVFVEILRAERYLDVAVVLSYLRRYDSRSKLHILCLYQSFERSLRLSLEITLLADVKRLYGSSSLLAHLLLVADEAKMLVRLDGLGEIL